MFIHEPTAGQHFGVQVVQVEGLTSKLMLITWSRWTVLRIIGPCVWMRRPASEWCEAESFLLVEPSTSLLESFTFNCLIQLGGHQMVAPGSCLLMVVVHEVWELPKWQAAPRLARILKSS